MNSAAATTIRQRLEALKPQVLEVARRYGASNLRIYGSIATGQEHPASDLDLLIDLPKGQSLLGLISLRQELEDLLGCPVDVTEAENLHPLIRSQILEQALALLTRTVSTWRVFATALSASLNTPQEVSRSS